MDLTAFLDAAIVMTWVVAIGWTGLFAYALMNGLQHGRRVISRPIDEQWCRLGAA